MSHSDIIRQLLPIPLTGVADADIDIEGAALDACQASAEVLLREMVASSALTTLQQWEHLCGLTPPAGETVSSRRDAVVTKLRELGRLDVTYYYSLADGRVLQIHIEECRPFMPGWGMAGYNLNQYDAIWIWKIWIQGIPVYRFRTGQSYCGERLAWWRPAQELVDLFNALKPAHTLCLFGYVE